MGRLRRLVSQFTRGTAAGFDGTSGRPRSGNGASSTHLFWVIPPQARGPEWVAAECTWMIDELPRDDHLYFWAMQASMVGDGPGSAAHTGPQWVPGGRTCVNWGGYGPHGAELEGTTSALPSPDGNPNTRDHRWSEGVPYRLRIERGEPLLAPDRRRCWRASITDLGSGEVTVVRDLFAAGDRLADVMVWSEVFAPCDAPPVTVRWWDLALVDGANHRFGVNAARVNYQALRDGGCVTSDSTVEAGRFVQRCGVRRSIPQGTVLRLE